MRFEFDNDLEAVIWGVGFFALGGIGLLLDIGLEISFFAVFWFFLGKRSAKLLIWIVEKIIQLIRYIKK